MTSDGRRGRTVDDLSPADVVGRLGVLLEAIEAGQIEAKPGPHRVPAARLMCWRWSPTR